MIWNNKKEETNDFQNEEPTSFDNLSNEFELEENYGNENNYIEQNNINTKETYTNVEPNYNEQGFTNFVKKTTRSKWFWPTIIFLVLLIILVLIFRGCESTTGTLKDINVNTPDIVYVGEKTKIYATATGSGNLKNTHIRFSTSNGSIVELDTKRTLTGKKVEDTIIPIATGKFALYIDAELEEQKLERKERQIVICKKFNESAFQSNTITVEKGKQTTLNLDLGKDLECSQNISFNPNNKNITIDEKGTIKGNEIGTTNLNISNGSTNITITVNVIDGENKIAVKGVKLNKTQTSLQIGATEKLTATINPTNASNKAIIWKTSNESVATVSNTGVIKGIGKGTATITAETVDGKFKATTKVTITDKKTDKPTTTKDTTAPKITSVKMFSNNKDQTKATDGDMIFLKMEFNEVIKTKPQVEIAGQIFEVKLNNNGKSASAQKIITGSFKTGEVSLKISNYKDAAGNTGNIINNVTTGKKVTIYRDEDKPYATSVTMTSNNNDKTLAKKDDTITLKATFNEAITKPTVKIAGTTVTPTLSNGDKTVIATLKVTDSTTLGETSLSITNYKDKKGNAGNNITNVTDSKKVTVYKLSGWSNPTTTACTTGELCQKITAYQTQTKTETGKSCASWSGYTATACAVDGVNCKSTAGYANYNYIGAAKLTYEYDQSTNSNPDYLKWNSAGSATDYDIYNMLYGGVSGNYCYEHQSGTNYYEYKCNTGTIVWYNNNCACKYSHYTCSTGNIIWSEDYGKNMCYSTSSAYFSHYGTGNYGYYGVKTTLYQTCASYSYQYSYSGWSNPTTTACTVNNTTCQSITAYQTRTRITK